MKKNNWGRIWQLTHDLYCELEEIRNPNGPFEPEPEYEDGFYELDVQVEQGCYKRAYGERKGIWALYYHKRTINHLPSNHKVVRKIDLEES